MRIIKEGGNKRFIELVDAVEDGYKDLKRLGLEREITTTSSISMIERKLPASIKRERAKLVSTDNSTVDKTDKFPSLLSFLLTQKRAIEYDTRELRLTTTSTIKGSAHYAKKIKNKESVERQEDNTRPQNNKCLFHRESYYRTSECKFYLSKPNEDKMKILKEKGAYWSCLQRGHRLLECKKKRPCGVNRCTKWHHQTLHKDEKIETSLQGISRSASVCDNNITDSCLLQIQRIPTKCDWINVLWDSGASLCFITNDKAKAERLKGTKVELSIIKLEGENEKIPSTRCKLSLIDNKVEKFNLTYTESIKLLQTYRA